MPSVTCPQCNEVYEEGKCGIRFISGEQISIRCVKCNCQFDVEFKRKKMYYALPFIKTFQQPNSVSKVRGNG